MPILLEEVDKNDNMNTARDQGPAPILDSDP